MTQTIADLWDGANDDERSLTMKRYKLLDQIPWELLHQQKVRFEVSENYIIGVFQDGSIVVLAQAVKSRGARKTPEPEGLNG